MVFNRNILLIYPPDKEECTTPEVPPLGLAHLASYIRNHTNGKYKVSIWDLNLNRLAKEQFKERLLKLEEQPDIIGIGGIVTVFNHLLWMSKICKEVFPQAILISGGSVASTVPHLLFRHSPIDICIEGEGEITLLELLENIEKGANLDELHDIKGLFLWDRINDRLIHTPSRPANPNLDTLGMPAYDLIDVEKYAINGILDLRAYGRDLPQELFLTSNLHMPIVSSRGCIGRCNFCYRQFPKIELNSADFIKNHIFFLHNEYGINVVTFADELFNISERRLNEMIQCLSEVKQKIPNFYFRIGGARTDVINASILKKLRDLGCFQIIYGLESGSQKMLNLMRKKITVEQNYKAVMAAKEAGLHCVPQFIIGLPGEDTSTLRDTFRFINYPGSEIYQYALGKRLIKDEFNYVSSLAGTNIYPLELADIPSKKIRAILRKFMIMREFKKRGFWAAFSMLLLKVAKKASPQRSKKYD